MEKMKINDVVVKQPDAGLGYDFETTYTEDSGRVMSGKSVSTALFTVEAFSYSASNLTKNEMKTILQAIAKGKRFNLYYLSPYYGEWRTDKFYVGKGSLKVGSWNEDDEIYTELSFNMVGVNPLD